MTPPTRGVLRRRVAVLWLVVSLGPLLLYFLTRSYVDSDAVALAISAGVPAAVTVVAAAWRRQVRLLSALAVVGFGVALAATAMTGGSSLPLKLYRPLVTGVVGLVVLVSALLRRPLLVPVLDRLAGRLPVIRLSRRTATVVTVIIGVSFLSEALVTVSLALTMRQEWSSATHTSNARVLAGLQGWITRLGRCPGDAPPRASSSGHDPVRISPVPGEVVIRGPGPR